MKTIRLHLEERYNTKSRLNPKSALRAIGLHNPYGIQFLSIAKRYERYDAAVALNTKELIKLGELNVYRRLNKSLGRNKHFSIRLIRLSCAVKVVEREVGGASIYLHRVQLPWREFVLIISTIFQMLDEADKTLKTDLEKREENDVYSSKKVSYNKKLRTVAPIQTNVVLSCEIDPRLKGLKELQGALKRQIVR